MTHVSLLVQKRTIGAEYRHPKNETSTMRYALSKHIADPPD